MNAIDVAGVWKRYRRTTTGGARTLRELGLHKRVTHWALQDVSLHVRPGESVGLIGLNGSGKSTLLRVIAGVTKQTRGSVETHGVIGGLLALGSGLNASLSAEENAFTGALLAGVPRRRVPSLLPDIAKFAELEDVFHEPMRTFSDGMRLRLSFSTAIHVDPQILLIDEVLAVGDARFREKCLTRLRAMREGGITFVVVSHTLSQIEGLCERAVWMERGSVRFAGPIAEVIKRYEESNAVEAPDRATVPGSRRFGTGELAEVIGIDLVRVDAPSTPIRLTRTGQPAAVTMTVRPRRAECPTEVRVCVSIHRNTDWVRPVDVGTTVAIPRGAESVVRLELDRLDLGGGSYSLNAGVYTADGSACLDFVWQAVTFDVDGPVEPGAVVPPMRWTSTS